MVLLWFEDPAQRHEAGYVALTRSSTPPFGSDLRGFPTMPVRGEVAHLVWVGDPGVAELALTWSEGGRGCGYHTLHMTSRGFSEREAVSEMRRIAASLG